MRRKKNMIHLQMIQLERSVVYFEHDLSTTGLHIAISIKGSLKEGPG